MTVRYRIVGTIQIDPLPGGAPAAVGEVALEQALVALAVTDALAESSGCRFHRRFETRRSASPERMVVPADLAALIAELQSEWDELEIG